MSAPWHGTAGGYTNHACRCDQCTKAWTVYMRSVRSRLKANRIRAKAMA